ncbi:MAG: 50S ribosomal protein L18, partial [Patescibacteria group bacterium]|nr:50S ribosomal protein L18 [Patescibacteria group bacterium]
KKLHNRSQRQGRIRAVVSGTPERPRLHVFISNQHISAQIIDDSTHKTLASATTVGQKTTGTMTEKAVAIGTEIATKAKSAKITAVVFDRGGKLYHGRVAALADAARKSGLEF